MTGSRLKALLQNRERQIGNGMQERLQPRPAAYRPMTGSRLKARLQNRERQIGDGCRSGFSRDLPRLAR